MPRSGPRQIYKYSQEFRLAAVRLSQVPGMQVKAVATALEIHPFMLSKWRKDVRDGTLRGRLPKATPAGPTREIAQLQALERKHALLQVGGRRHADDAGARCVASAPAVSLRRVDRLGELFDVVHQAVELPLRVDLGPSAKERDVAHRRRARRAQALRAARARTTIPLRDVERFRHEPIDHQVAPLAIQRLPCGADAGPRDGIVREIVRLIDRRRGGAAGLVVQGIGRRVVEGLRGGPAWRACVEGLRGEPRIAGAHRRIRNERVDPARRELLQIRGAMIAGVGGDERRRRQHAVHRLHDGQQQFLLRAGAVRLRVDDDLSPGIRRFPESPGGHPKGALTASETAQFATHSQAA